MVRLKIMGWAYSHKRNYLICEGPKSEISFCYSSEMDTNSWNRFREGDYIECRARKISERNHVNILHIDRIEFTRIKHQELLG